MKSLSDQLPTDRINNFCDAVFAIAMTLLILEIKVPTDESMKVLGFGKVLRGLIPSFTGFLISFLVTALYWRAHLTAARYVKFYNNKLLWLTVWLLFFVVLLPFSTAIYSKFFNHNYVFIFYCFNLVMIGVFHYLLLKSIIDKEGYDEKLTAIMASWLKVRALLAPIIWLVSAAWVFVDPFSARFMFLTIFVFQIIIDKRYNKKLPEVLPG